MDEYTERVTEGYGSRLMQSLKGMVFGLLLFVAAFPVLWLNEGYAVRTARSLSQGAREVVSVAADRVDPANEGKLVHVAGMATTSDTVNDPLFHLSANAIRLHRKVEMYQWRETSSTEKRKNLGGSQTTTTTYRYDPVWSEQRIDSASFRRPEHQNPPMPFSSADYDAGQVTVGSFRLTRNQISRFEGGNPIDVSAATLPDSIRDRARASGGGFETGDPASPQVGDLRITFTQLKQAEVSVVARQVRDTFEPYRAKAGSAIDLLAMGVQSADEMFATAQTHNSIRTWILRGVGLILMLIGLALLLNPLKTLGDVVPFVGSILQAGIGIVSFAVALCLSLLTIAIAWVAYRPLVGIALLAGATLIVFLVARVRKPKTRPVPQPSHA